MKNKVLAYSLKVWLTSVVLTPLIYILIYGMAHGIDRQERLSVLMIAYAYAIGCNTAFSVLSWSVFYLSISPVVSLKWRRQNKQLALLFIGEALIFGTFHLVTALFPGIDPPDYNFLMVCHCLVVGAGICKYQLDYGKDYKERVITYF